MEHAQESATHAQKLHGRRRGRKLRDAQQALVDQALPRFRLSAEGLARTGPDALFTTPCPLWLEIGFGGGEHAFWQAQQHPEIGVLACEVFQPGIVQLLGRLETGTTQNLRIVDDDARKILSALPASSVARVFVLFPDPWPKARHHKRRLISRETMAVLAHVMADDGELRLATDVPAYLRVMLSVACGHPDFEWLARSPRDWRNRAADWPPTRYEAKAIAAGRVPTYLQLRRRQRQS